LNNIKDQDFKKFTIIADFKAEEKPQFMSNPSKRIAAVGFLAGFYWDY